MNQESINEFYVIGGDAVGYIKILNNGLNKLNFKVNVISDCIISYNMKKVEEMLI